jgi:hypothetical protein
VTYAPQSSPGPRRLPAFPTRPAAALLALAALIPFHSGSAQERQTIAAPTRVYATAGGASLGLLPPGSGFTSRRTDGASVELLVEGWIFARSVGATDRDGFDLEVTQPGGQNLRASASAAAPVVARLARGVLLQKVEADGHGWVHVRRYAWVPRSALKAPPAPAPAAAKPAAGSPTSGGGTDSAARPDVPLAPAPIGSGNTDRGEVARATPLMAAPGGATATELPAGTEVRVLARAGDWTQVAVSGWVHSSDLGAPSDDAQVGVSAAQVRANPAQYIGKLVEWRLQVISVMVADELRPEIPAGRSYLLTRGPLPEQGFVYVVLPPDQVDRFRQLAPLKELTLRVQVRAAATRYLPNPVVDLVQVVAGS